MYSEYRMDHMFILIMKLYSVDFNQLYSIYCVVKLYSEFKLYCLKILYCYIIVILTNDLKIVNYFDFNYLKLCLKNILLHNYIN